MTPQPAAKWIRFLPVASGTRTPVWHVVTHLGGFLGAVRWRGAWRRFAFFPDGDTVYEPTCLRDLAAFLDWAMAVRRETRRAEAADAVRALAGLAKVSR